MPAPQAIVMQNLAKQQFRGFAIKVPTDWRQPQGAAGGQYAKALQIDKSTSGVPTPMPPALFQPASNSKGHCEVAKVNSDKFTAFIDGICSAICSAWSQWQSMASMVGVMVNAVTASAGQVLGPPMGPLILKEAPKATPQEMKYSNAIANAIGNGWTAYQASIKVPGLPWYPAFAAMPSPVAPPTPNVPCPVIALTQVTAPISKNMLKMQMIGLLADPMAKHHRELFDSIADAFEKCFQTWQASTQVTNVLGTGPVPTFAPPFVPAGPVVGGTAFMSPGGFV